MEQRLAKEEGGPVWAPPPRAPYATNPAASRGRLHLEGDSATRSPFQRDRDRIIHSQAFRRLKGKTQVFVAHEGDHYRTRLTHSLEVSQIARSVARTLGLDEDLAEAVSLAHDIGHPPFGHAGESALNTCMLEHGGFDHNAQTLRVLTKLEERFPSFDGLNLTWETLEGVVKHNGPLLRRGTNLTDLPAALQTYAKQQDLELDTWAGPEAQIAALADDVAYNNHDIDDGWRAGLFRMEELLDVPFVGDVLRDTAADYPGLVEERLMAETVRRLIGARINDMVAETQKRAAKLNPRAAQDVRNASEAVVAFSDEMREHEAALRRFLFDRMYRHTRVNRAMSQARRIVSELFDLFLAEPEVMPEWWYRRTNGAGDSLTARHVCDYIAGMTDSFAIDEHRRLFNLDRWG